MEPIRKTPSKLSIENITTEIRNQKSKLEEINEVMKSLRQQNGKSNFQQSPTLYLKSLS